VANGVTWRIARGTDETQVALIGELTEGTKLDDLVAAVRGVITLDLSGVRRMNSLGVRELVDAVSAMRARGRLAFERCSPAIVNQLNMLPELCDKVAIRSVFAPMECPKCLSERELLVDVTRGERFLSLVCACEECGAEMDLAEPRDRFFAFLEGT
jgi:anti-anti-sigma regulatory factor